MTGLTEEQDREMRAAFAHELDRQRRALDGIAEALERIAEALVRRNQGPGR